MKLRERPKVTRKTGRQGQTQGQGQQVDPAVLQTLAAQNGVSPEWLRLVTEGSLDDPAFVQAIREANLANLWHHVSPAAQEALARATRNFEIMGGSLDGVLVFLLDVLSHVSENANFFATRTPIQFVEEHIEAELADFRRRAPLALQEEINVLTIQADDERHNLRLQVEALRPHADRGRRSLESSKRANEVKTRNAQERARLDKAAFDAKAKGQLKKVAYFDVGFDAKRAKRPKGDQKPDGVTPDAIRKRISRNLQK